MQQRPRRGRPNVLGPHCFLEIVRSLSILILHVPSRLDPPRPAQALAFFLGDVGVEVDTAVTPSSVPASSASSPTRSSWPTPSILAASKWEMASPLPNPLGPTSAVGLLPASPRLRGPLDPFGRAVFFHPAPAFWGAGAGNVNAFSEWMGMGTPRQQVVLDGHLGA